VTSDGGGLWGWRSLKEEEEEKKNERLKARGRKRRMVKNPRRQSAATSIDLSI
jgi:hypothetical protein